MLVFSGIVIGLLIACCLPIVISELNEKPAKCKNCQCKEEK